MVWDGVSLVLLGAIIIPLGSGLLLLVWRGMSPQKARYIDLYTNLVTAVFVLGLYPLVESPPYPLVFFPNVLPPFGLSLSADIFSYLMASTAVLIWCLVTWYSNVYIADEHYRRYHAFSSLTLGCMLGVLLAGDFFTLFLFFEGMALTSYVLVVHDQTRPAMGAGSRYLFMSLAGGLTFFFALLGTQQLVGTTQFIPGGGITEPSTLALFVYLGYLAAFGVKAGMFPLHVWLPLAHPVAPSPASALLSGLMIKTGAYGMIRVVTQLFSIDLMQSAHLDTWLMVLGAISIIWGSILALGQDDIKRRLAYSSIGQIGYILVGIALLTERALAGGIYHIIGHALMKTTLFLTAGVVIHETGRRNISEMAGVGRELPLPMAAFTIAALAMIGIPGLTGFVSKWELAMGALDAGQPLVVLLFLVSSFLNALYYMPVILMAFFGKAETPVAVHRLPAGMVIPLVLLALASVALGLFPHNIPLVLSREAASFLMMGF